MSDTSESLKGLESHKDVFQRVKTAGAVAIPPEIFESMFLAPKMPVRGHLRNTFGNPTPVALAGFLLCSTPLSMVLFGWVGSGGLGAAEVGNYFFLGGALLTLGGIGEFLLGNTFPQIVFMSFGGFWFAFGATLVPWFNAYGAYSPTDNVADGLEAPMFYNSYAFFMVAEMILCSIYCAASVRTNIVFFFIFLLLIPTFGTLGGSFYARGRGDPVAAETLQHVGAALLLTLSLLTWYLFLALVLLAVDFPYILPVGDLSTIVKGHADRERAKRERV